MCFGEGCTKLTLRLRTQLQYSIQQAVLLHYCTRTVFRIPCLICPLLSLVDCAQLGSLLVCNDCLLIYEPFSCTSTAAAVVSSLAASQGYIFTCGRGAYLIEACEAIVSFIATFASTIATERKLIATPKLRFQAGCSALSSPATVIDCLLACLLLLRDPFRRLQLI